MSSNLLPEKSLLIRAENIGKCYASNLTAARQKAPERCRSLRVTLSA